MAVEIPRIAEIEAALREHAHSIAYLSLLTLEPGGGTPSAGPALPWTPEGIAQYGSNVPSGVTPDPTVGTFPFIDVYLSAVRIWLTDTLTKATPPGTTVTYRLILHAPKNITQIKTFQLAYTRPPRTQQIASSFGSPPAPLPTPPSNVVPFPQPPAGFNPVASDPNDPLGSLSTGPEDDEPGPEDEDEGEDDYDDFDPEGEEDDESDVADDDEDSSEDEVVYAPTRRPRTRRTRTESTAITQRGPLAGLPATVSPETGVVRRQPNAKYVPVRTIKTKGYLRIVRMSMESAELLHEQTRRFASMVLENTQQLAELHVQAHKSALAQVDGLRAQVSELVETLADQRLAEAENVANMTKNSAGEETKQIVGKAGIEQVGSVVKAVIRMKTAQAEEATKETKEKSDASDDDYVSADDAKEESKELEPEPKRGNVPNADAMSSGAASDLPPEVVAFLRKNPKLVKRLSDGDTQEALAEDDNIAQIVLMAKAMHAAGMSGGGEDTEEKD